MLYTWNIMLYLFFKKLSFEKKKGNDESMNQSYKLSLIAKNII